MRARKAFFGVICLVCFCACESVDTGVGTTSEDDYTLTLQVVDRFVHVGDQAPIVLRLKRTDNSNLENGFRGVILITTSVHGQVDFASIPFNVTDDTTRDLVKNIVFTAESSGVAEVRASFLDATALIKVLISGVDI